MIETLDDVLKMSDKEKKEHCSWCECLQKINCTECALYIDRKVNKLQLETKK